VTGQRSFRILVVEDDNALRDEIAAQLRRWTFEPVFPASFSTVTEDAASLAPDLILLDINLPVLDGHEWCRRIRAHSKVPIVMISARDSGAEVVMGLSSGADDYVTKPFEPEVLLAKVRALLRRTYDWVAAEGNKLVRGELIFDVERGLVVYGEAHAELTRNEGLILATLLRAGGAVVTRDQLATALWREEVFVDDNTLNVNVARLRSTLASLGREDAIHTVKGQGYQFP
jgi:DNA-binding response OmpR family regulator